MHAEVFDVAQSHRAGRLLLSAAQGAPRRRRGGAHRPVAQGPRRPGAVAAAVPRRVVRRSGGVRVRPQRRLRPLPADDQPPPQGAPRGGPARPQQARRLGVLPRSPAGAHRPQHPSRRRGRVTPLARRVGAELVGTAFLVMAVVGSGIAAQRLSPHDPGLQLLENSLATGAVLVSLILALQPVSASFNPVVTLAERALGLVGTREAGALVGAQLVGGLVGVALANLMYGLDAISLSHHSRTGGGLWLAEVVATVGLVLLVFGRLRGGRPEWVALVVGGYIAAAYWFTSSTSFANPAVTAARALSDTFAGITPASVPMFVLMQLAGGGICLLLVKALYPRSSAAAGQLGARRSRSGRPS